MMKAMMSIQQHQQVQEQAIDEAIILVEYMIASSEDVGNFPAVTRGMKLLGSAF